MASGCQMPTQRHSLLLDQLCLDFAAVQNLHPTTLMSDDSEDILDISQVSCPDLLDIPGPEAEALLFTDGSSHQWSQEGLSSRNYSMGHHTGTNLATGHIGPEAELTDLSVCAMSYRQRGY